MSGQGSNTAITIRCETEGNDEVKRLESAGRAAHMRPRTAARGGGQVRGELMRCLCGH